MLRKKQNGAEGRKRKREAEKRKNEMKIISFHFIAEKRH